MWTGTSFHFQVSSNDERLIQVLEPVRGDGTDYVVSYPIALQFTPALQEVGQSEASIDVRCHSTGQKQSVPVRIRLMGDREGHMDLGESTILRYFFS